MLILLITQEPPLSPDEVATGNAIRTAQLDGALRRAGHTISQTWLDTSKKPHADAFRNRDELQATINRQVPDAVLVAYWELLELLPFELPQPVILDFVAPRPLESLYEHPELVGTELQRLQSSLSKCDLVLTGNEAQRKLLWFTLLQAGFDLRGCEPILVVPLAAEPVGMPESDPQSDGWTLVSGGVSWPWRKSNIVGMRTRGKPQRPIRPKGSHLIPSSVIFYWNPPISALKLRTPILNGNTASLSARWNFCATVCR